MIKWILSTLLIVFLSGCSGQSDELKTGMELRGKLLNTSGCSFTAHITADYGTKLHIFSLACSSDSQGSLSFTVIEPESISDICGKLSADGGTLTFTDTALHFPLLADEQLSPVSAPWILLHSLRSGYLSSACTDNGNIWLSIDDHFEEKPLRLDVWLNSEQTPARAEILYDGKRILSVAVENFSFL